MLYLPYEVDFQYEYSTGTDDGTVHYTYNYINKQWNVDRDLFDIYDDFEQSCAYTMDGFDFIPTSPSETEAELRRYLSEDCWHGDLDPWDIFNKQTSMMSFEGYMYYHGRYVRRVWWRTELLNAEYRRGDWKPIMDRWRYEDESLDEYGNGIKEPDVEVVRIGKHHYPKRYAIYRLQRENSYTISMDYDLIFPYQNKFGVHYISRVHVEFYTHTPGGESDLFCGTASATVLLFDNKTKPVIYAPPKTQRANLICIRIPKKFNQIDVWSWKRNDPWLIDKFIDCLEGSNNPWL